MILILLIIAPFIGGVLCLLLEHVKKNFSYWIALISTLSIFLCSFLLLYSIKFHEHKISNCVPQYWYIEYCLKWIPRFGISIHLALDNLSLLMVNLSSFIGVLSVISSYKEINHRNGFFYFNLLCIIGSSIGIFLSIDMFLFFFFWEIMLIPIYFLVTFFRCDKLNNYKNYLSSVVKLFIYSQIGGLTMFLSIIGLVVIYYNKNNIWTFCYKDLLSVFLTKETEFLLILGFLIAFLIKMPIIPFHGWVQDFHSLTPIFGSIDIIGTLIKISPYGILRFVTTLFPCSFKELSPLIIIILTIGVLYSSLESLLQRDIKKIISYSNIVHSGVVLIAIFVGNKLSYYGAIMQTISGSLSSAGMFIVFGQICKKLNTKDIYKIKNLKIYDSDFVLRILMFFIFSTIGIPGTFNFVSEVIILFGIFEKYPVSVIFILLSLILILFSLLSIIKYIFYSPAELVNKFYLSISMYEKLISLSLIIVILTLGIFPQFIINRIFFV